MTWKLGNNPGAAEARRIAEGQVGSARPYGAFLHTIYPVYLTFDLTDPASAPVLWGVLDLEGDRATFRVDDRVHKRWGRRSRLAQDVLGVWMHWLLGEIRAGQRDGEDAPAFLARLSADANRSNLSLGVEPIAFEAAEGCARMMWQTGFGPRARHG